MNAGFPDKTEMADSAGVRPLNPVEVEVIHLFVQFSRAPGQPCKIYNILTVGAPVIYIGPKPSHVTEILNRPGDEYPSIRVAQGEAEALANQIRGWRQGGATGKRQLPVEMLSTFSPAWLLPRLAALIGGPGEEG